MTSAARELTSQREIGKYHLVAELARGGMGNVYLAVTQGPGGFEKIVVLKELKPEFCDDETYVAMFLDEARLAARLTHPNIVQTNEVGSDGARHYMVMEFLDGRSLHRLLRYFANSSLFPVGAHLRILAEALMGLQYAHDLRGFDGEPLGIVHRDVSPLNVVITFDGQTKILDFGIAKTVDSSLETRAGTLKGRVAYMAPEQARGGKVDRRADVYSAGVMIWEAAARRRLWPGMTEVQILACILGEGPPSLRSVVPDAPADLDAICARAMARDPAARYPTAVALLHDLDTHLSRRTDMTTMRAIGSLLTQTFREERQRTTQAIEETLMRVRGGSRSGVMPVVQNVIADAVRASDSSDFMVDMGSLSSIPELSLNRSGVGSGAPAGLVDDAISSSFFRPRWRATRPLVTIAAVGILAGTALSVIAYHAGSNAHPVAAALSVSKPMGSVETANVEPTVRAPVPAAKVQPTVDEAVAPREVPPPKVQYEPVRRVAPSAPRTPVFEPARGAPAPEPQPTTLPTHPDVDPSGGRTPYRPIVTSNPYGAP